jgi:hypothetical protein
MRRFDFAPMSGLRGFAGSLYQTVAGSPSMLVVLAAPATDRLLASHRWLPGRRGRQYAFDDRIAQSR